METKLCRCGKSTEPYLLLAGHPLHDDGRCHACRERYAKLRADGDRRYRDTQHSFFLEDGNDFYQDAVHGSLMARGRW